MSATPTKSSSLVPNPDFAKPATPEQIRRTAARLTEHGFRTVVVADGAEALRTVISLVPEHSEVFTATSATLAEIGAAKELEESGRYNSVRKRMMALDRTTHDREIRELGATPPYVLGSVHAVTEDGDLLIASATGSQLAPYVYGAGKVIWVVGAQKVVPTIQAGLARLREYAYPMEDARALKAYGVNSGLNKILIMSRETRADRATVILVQEKLGF